MSIIKKQAIFRDSNDNIQYGEIIINNIYISIHTIDENKNETGYINIFYHPNKRLFLDTVYCYDKYRRTNIATIISELSDYILKEYEGYVIRGAYKPGQLSTDRDLNIKRRKEELDLAARKFYHKNGYEIIAYEEYKNNKDKYPYLTLEDFYLSEEGPTTIVAKQLVKKDYPFYEEGGIIYYNNYNKSDIRKKL